MMTNLKEYKLRRKYEKVVSDIDAILLVFDLTSRGLAHFKNYVAVQELISVLATNATILQMQQRKMQKELEKMKGEET